MRVEELHAWHVTPEEAIRVQRDLAPRVREEPPLAFTAVRTVAGVDVSSERGRPLLTAGVVVCDVDTLNVVEVAVAQADTTFPYIPGLLSFREAPVILAALARLTTDPDVLFADGQGRAHPRRLGIASHVGLCVERPTVGVAKSVLVGSAAEPGAERGCAVPLWDGQEIIGSVVRTRAGVAPVIVSVGHQIDLSSAIPLVLRCVRAHRLPEPTRLAHLHVNAVRRTGRGIPATALVTREQRLL